MSDHLFYQSAVQLPTIARAEGIYAWDTDGKRHIDACSGAIVAQLGHGHPAIRDAMLAQLDKVAFSYRTQFENQPAVDLAEKLVGLAGGRFDRVFFSSGGSESVESALKLARQYWVCRGEPARSVFIARQPSYHGSTMGALAMTSYTPLTRPFEPMIQLYPKVASPTQYRVPAGKTAEQHALDCADELDAAIREVGAERVAAFVAEPIGGASTGAEVPHDAYFTRIREICSRHGVLLILDEVMTGIGRTGRWFGFQHWNVDADILCVAKGLGAGYYPTSAIVTRAELTDPILASGGFQHGYTYAGNPLASATALAVIDVIEREGLVENAAQTGGYLRSLLDDLAARHDFIGDVRGRGFLLAIEYVADRDTKTPFDPALRFGEQVTRAAREQGVIVYPRKSLMGETGDHTLIAPPLITTRAQCDEIVERLDLAFRTLGR